MANDNNKKRLSAAAWIGIAIAIVVVGAAIALMIIYLPSSSSSTPTPIPPGPFPENAWIGDPDFKTTGTSVSLPALDGGFTMYGGGWDEVRGIGSMYGSAVGGVSSIFLTEQGALRHLKTTGTQYSAAASSNPSKYITVGSWLTGITEDYTNLNTIHDSGASQRGLRLWYNTAADDEWVEPPLDRDLVAGTPQFVQCLGKNKAGKVLSVLEAQGDVSGDATQRSVRIYTFTDEYSYSTLVTVDCGSVSAMYGVAVGVAGAVMYVHGDAGAKLQIFNPTADSYETTPTTTIDVANAPTMTTADPFALVDLSDYACVYATGTTIEIIPVDSDGLLVKDNAQSIPYASLGVTSVQAVQMSDTLVMIHDTTKVVILAPTKTPNVAQKNVYDPAMAQTIASNSKRLTIPCGLARDHGVCNMLVPVGSGSGDFTQYQWVLGSKTA